MAHFPRMEVQPPTATPAGFGLVSVASTPDASTDPHWRRGLRWKGLCPTDPLAQSLDTCLAGGVGGGDPTPEGAEKAVTRGIPQREGPAVTLYGGTLCSTGGTSLDADRARAEAVLALGEGMTLDRIVETGGGNAVLATESLQGTATLPDADTIYTSIDAGIAHAERLASLRGSGVIHMPRWMAVLGIGASVLTRNGARLETVLGTPVAAGPGYQGVLPDAAAEEAAFPAGLTWVYVTGQVLLMRGDRRWADGGQEMGTIDTKVNDRMVVAERTFAWGWECGAVAIPVDTSGLTTTAPPLDPPPDP